MIRIIKTKYLQEVLILAMLLMAACYARTRLPAEGSPVAPIHSAYKATK